MKTAEFLNTKENYVLQVLPENAGDDPERGLVKVPEGAVALVTYANNAGYWFSEDNRYKGFGAVAHISSNFDEHSSYKSIYEYSNYVRGITLWQRNTLQQKVDEVRQHLNINSNDKLSIMIGRESSYLRKLLKRDASTKTKEKVISELDDLIYSQVAIGEYSGGSIDKPLEIASNKSTDDNYVQLLRKYKDWKNTAIVLFFGLIVAILALASVPFCGLS